MSFVILTMIVPAGTVIPAVFDVISMPGISPSVGAIATIFADPDTAVHVNCVLTTAASSIALSVICTILDLTVVVVPLTTRLPLISVSPSTVSS